MRPTMRVNHRSVSHPTAGSSHVLLLTFAGLFATQTLLPALPLFGQTDSRVAEIEKERQERSAHLEPDGRSKFEQKLVDIEQTKLLERLLGGVHGFQAKIGGLVSGSGFAITRGPGGMTPPSMDGPWTIVSAKTEGVKPGFVM